MAGILGACITAPHLFGPLIATSLDTAPDGRTVIAWACMAHSVTLAAAVLLYPVTPPIVPGLLLITSGLVGPLLTGGISSRLTAIAGRERTSQRRAQGWDVATYGTGGTIGPSLVAAVSARADPAVAALILPGSMFVAAAAVRLLPYTPPAAVSSDVPRPGRAANDALKRPLAAHALHDCRHPLPVAALPITAIASTGELRVEPDAAGILTAVYGLGGLLGSAGVMTRPMRTDANPSMSWPGTAVGVALCGDAFAGSFPVAVGAYCFAGVLNSYFFAATLAACSEYAPPEARGQVFVGLGP